MKNKAKITFIAVCFILVIFLIIYFSRETYTIKVKKVDSFSPERILEVYKNNKKIDYKEIQYEDDTTLCDSSNPTVAYVDLIDEKKLQIVLKNNKRVKAKIVED